MSSTRALVAGIVVLLVAGAVTAWTSIYRIRVKTGGKLP
jgi:hypothetical protein